MHHGCVAGANHREEGSGGVVADIAKLSVGREGLASCWAVPTATIPLSSRPRLDLLGALASATGLFMIVLGFSTAETDGWSAGTTVGFLVAGVVLLAVFAVIEGRSSHPLLPLRVLADRNRAGSYLTVLFAGVGTFGPMVAATMVTAVGVNGLLLQRVGPRPLIVTGMAVAAVGMVVLTGLDVDSTYAARVLPSLVLIGAGIGLALPAASNTATARVDLADAGISSSLVNVGQQVGGFIGTALLNTIAVSATTAYLSTHGGGAAVGAQATVHGYTVAFWWSAAIFAVGAVVCGVLLRGRTRGAAAEIEADARGATAAVAAVPAPAAAASGDD